VEVHRWIEDQSRQLTGLADDEDLEGPSTPLEPSRIAAMEEQFRHMGFAGRRMARLDTGEPMAELRFLLRVGDRVVRGRIDAVYETDACGLEIVDFKTGGRVDEGEVDQLVIYAAALRLLGVESREPLKVTYCYLADGSQSSRFITASQAEAALAAIEARLR
jgi:DNA helicase-2/ATP-dependent DNA helicase PcrA